MTGTITQTREIDGVRELGAFLRARRERLTPDQVGLTRTRRRRTPGLRREEVADLANVSVDYVVRLEQARGLRPSPEVLDALASALLLTSDERAYLFDLARQRPNRQQAGGRDESTRALARLVEDLAPHPAMLIDHCFDLLAWNAPMDKMLLGLDTIAPADRNTLRLCLLDQRFEGYYRDADRVVADAVADLRAAWALHPDDDRLTGLVDDLIAGSPAFAAQWDEQTVGLNARGTKAIRHPEVGELTVQYEVLNPLEDPSLRLVLYRPADPESQDALAALGG